MHLLKSVLSLPVETETREAPGGHPSLIATLHAVQSLDVPSPDGCAFSRLLFFFFFNLAVPGLSCNLQDLY